MILAIWIIFGILTFYLTSKSYYRDCEETLSLLEMSDSQKKIINTIMTALISTLYGIFGPIGLVLICTIMVSKKISKFFDTPVPRLPL